MSAPRIALGGVVRTWDGAERTGLNAAYLHSICAVGGVPVVLSPLIGPAYAARALDGMDGLVLTGGGDVDPAWYGSDPSPRADPPNRERDLFELALFAAARQRELPILGICRGIQLMNVALGGTLYQDLPSERPGVVDHNRPGARTDRSHAIRLALGSLAAEALGNSDLRVNSFHHQGIRDLAPGLVPTGWSEDDLIEAVEGAKGQPWMLGVQWHPEEMHADARAPERGLFRALVEQALSAAASVDS
ncbi:MAG: gamma-glutamyl-gamma-aminobutyrate hydrolase family protein [Gemmatimonadales bacterium]|nr:gamma-glutamyl-gamma-aminobutyrate hydrolase family protein [Gemmatimonadales bacterium]